MTERGKKVFVVRNRLSKRDIADADIALQNVKKDNQFVRIAYFSGTPSHNKDFATITGALSIVMDRYPKVRLVLAGPLDPQDALARRFEDRIDRVPFASRPEHFKNIAAVHINLAPLEIGNPFCESKSELKWFEAGAVGVPTVAASTEPFREAIIDGVDGFVASTEEEWVAKLGILVEDEAFRLAMGQKARTRVLAEYTTEHANDSEYVAYLREKMKK